MACSSTDPISLSDHRDIIRGCSICLQIWTDPRSLPGCNHTFCLQCLKIYVQKKQEEKVELLCPYCHKEFSITAAGGVDALSFFHQEQLLNGPRITPDQKDDILKKRAQTSISTLFLSESSLKIKGLPGKGSVYGIAVIGNELFLTRVASNIEVHDINKFSKKPRRTLKISDANLMWPRLAACSHYNCLYVTDHNNPTTVTKTKVIFCAPGTVTVIYRVELANSSVTSWIVDGGCERISVTNNYNVLVTLRPERRILEYSTDGILIREISLDSSMDYPQHCVQLSDGNFVICHSALLPAPAQTRVCIVDARGRILKSYGGFPGSGADQLHNPHHLSADSNDHVFVADTSNNRVVLLSPALELLGTVQTPGHRFGSPDVLHLDEMNCRLYVGEGNGRVMVIEVAGLDDRE